MAVRPNTHYLGAFPLDSKALQQPFLDRIEAASGKPVLLQCDSKFAGHATIKVATNEQPAHVFFYKPEKEAVLPYLVAFQCEFALRTILADPAAQFDLVAKNNMSDDVAALMTNYHTGKNQVPASAVLQLAGKFGNGLGLQLRSMPITMRIDKQIHDDHPELRAFQQQSIDSQLQENMHALSPRAKELAPEEIIRPNASMNAAFAKFFSGLWNAPMVFAPYIAAGYSQVAAELLGYHEQMSADVNHDRELVDAWAKHLGLDRWFKTRAR